MGHYLRPRDITLGAMLGALGLGRRLKQPEAAWGSTPAATEQGEQHCIDHAIPWKIPSYGRLLGLGGALE